jgi:hypothetical protein
MLVSDNLILDRGLGSMPATRFEFGFDLFVRCSWPLAASPCSVGSVCSRRWCGTLNLSVCVRVSCAKLVLTFVEAVIVSSLGGIDAATLPAYDPPRAARQRVTTQTVLINLKPPMLRAPPKVPLANASQTGLINPNFVLRTIGDGLRPSIEPNCS